MSVKIHVTSILHEEHQRDRRIVSLSKYLLDGTTMFVFLTIRLRVTCVFSLEHIYVYMGVSFHSTRGHIHIYILGVYRYAASIVRNCASAFHSSHRRFSNFFHSEASHTTSRTSTRVHPFPYRSTPYYSIPHLFSSTLNVFTKKKKCLWFLWGRRVP